MPTKKRSGRSIVELDSSVRTDVVGRAHEIRLILAALVANRDLLLEGPPGTSKTTLLRAITKAFDVPFVFVEGNADLTTGKLVGHHDPAMTLAQGFSEATFVPGPLVRAMQSGGFLYVEEINRAPEETMNALLTAIAEREITVPRMGTVLAAEGFRLVASMNPFDNVGTSRISTSVYDRLCRIAVDYQSENEEVSIVGWRTEASDGSEVGGVAEATLAGDGVVRDGVVKDAVAVTRMTRRHPLIRQGSSVRGAIDLVMVARNLFMLTEAHRNQSEFADTTSDETELSDETYASAMRDAMHVALSGRIRLDDSSGASPEAILDEIWEQYFVLGKRVASPG